MRSLLARHNITILLSNYYLKTHNQGKDPLLTKASSCLELSKIRRCTVRVKVQQLASLGFVS